MFPHQISILKIIFPRDNNFKEFLKKFRYFSRFSEIRGYLIRSKVDALFKRFGSFCMKRKYRYIKWAEVQFYPWRVISFFHQSIRTHIYSLFFDKVAGRWCSSMYVNRWQNVTAYEHSLYQTKKIHWVVVLWDPSLRLEVWNGVTWNLSKQ